MHSNGRSRDPGCGHRDMPGSRRRAGSQSVFLGACRSPSWSPSGPAPPSTATAEVSGDPMVLLNDDVSAEPGFVAACTEASDAEAGWSPGCCCARRPGRIDSAGVVADRTLLGFDYLNGEPGRGARRSAADPLGPTGGAALYRRGAFEWSAASTRDLPLLRGPGPGAADAHLPASDCRLAPRTSGSTPTRRPRRGEQRVESVTGWSRGYMLRPTGFWQPAASLRSGRRRRGRDLRRAGACDAAPGLAGGCAAGVPAARATPRRPAGRAPSTSRHAKRSPCGGQAHRS